MWFTGKEQEKREFVIYSEQKKRRFTKMEYKEKIIEMVKKISNQGTLEYLYTFIKLFLEKWG